jgi:hypothetical protein
VSRIHTALGGLVALVFAASCGNSEDPYDHAILYEDKTESELRREVGPPSREQRITADEFGYCDAYEGAERVLFYDVPSRGSGKRVREMFGMSPAQSTVVCVNREGRIVHADTLLVD